MNKFYLFECNYGDDNDNYIADLIVEATTKDEAMDKLEAINEKDGYESNGGDQDYIDGMKYDDDDIPLHQDFYYQNEYETEEDAENEKQRCHASWGTIYDNNN